MIISIMGFPFGDNDFRPIVAFKRHFNQEISLILAEDNLTEGCVIRERERGGG